MSVIRAVPYIETALGGLTKTELETLKEVVNESGIAKRLSLIDSTYLPTNDDKGIYGCTFEFALGNVKNGILVWNSTTCMLLAYHRFQDMQMYTIDVANRKFTKVNEELTIEELRRVLDDSLEGKGGKVTPINPAKLAEIMEGDIGVSVDLNEGGTKVVASLDLTGGTAGKILAVNSDADDVEWVTRNKIYRHRVHYAYGDIVLDMTFENTIAQEIDGINGVSASATAYGILDTGLYFMPIYCKVNTDYYQLCECSLGQGLISVKLVSYGSAEDITLNPNGTFTDTVVEVI